MFLYALCLLSLWLLVDTFASLSPACSYNPLQLMHAYVTSHAASGGQLEESTSNSTTSVIFCTISNYMSGSIHNGRRHSVVSIFICLS